MEIRLARTQSFWRPVNPKNENDMSLYLCPGQPFLQLDWDKLPEWIKRQIKSSQRLKLITVTGMPEEAPKEEPETIEVIEETASFAEMTTPVVEEVKEESVVEKNTTKKKTKKKVSKKQTK